MLLLMLLLVLLCCVAIIVVVVKVVKSETDDGSKYGSIFRNIRTEFVLGNALEKPHLGN